MAVSVLSEAKCFGGVVRRLTHQSATVGCAMNFTVFVPPGASASAPAPVLYWLSGLTCTDENFITKAGAQQYAAKHGIALVCPDTSPRGLDIEGEDDSYDFGSGAGFYLNATQEPWATNYRMYDYVTEELPTLLAEHDLDSDRAAISGHSMGGHGAFTIALKNPGKYASASAFSPICNPSACDWGKKAFGGYLGDDQADWEEYDTARLVAKYSGPDPHLLVDQGTADSFLHQDQLQPESLEAACKESNTPVEINMREGYDHSYYFIATYIESHIDWHAKWLQEREE